MPGDLRNAGWIAAEFVEQTKPKCLSLSLLSLATSMFLSMMMLNSQPNVAVLFLLMLSAVSCLYKSNVLVMETTRERVRRTAVTITTTTSPIRNSSSYQHPVPEVERDAFDFDSLPLPIQVMEQYKAMHSVHQLVDDDENRKYAVLFYTCPLEAGNRLHQFTAGMYEYWLLAW